MKIDRNSDCHMHTVFSDGSAGIDEMVSAAIEKGLEAVTVTDHMPLPYDNRYAMHAGNIDEYRRRIRAAGRKYANRITVEMGLEFEYSTRFAHWIRSLADMGWDQRIGSVHSLFVDDRPCLVNGREGEFQTLLEHFGHSVEKVCTRYYETMQAAAQSGLFDIVGHMDVVKKHNAGGRYFSENAPWYRSLVLNTLDVIRKNGLKMEINTAGFNHPVGEQYPSQWIIREAVERGIRMVLGSDAHKPESLGQYFYTTDDSAPPVVFPETGKFGRGPDARKTMPRGSA